MNGTSKSCRLPNAFERSLWLPRTGMQSLERFSFLGCHRNSVLSLFHFKMECTKRRCRRRSHPKCTADLCPIKLIYFALHRDTSRITTCLRHENSFLLTSTRKYCAAFPTTALPFLLLCMRARCVRVQVQLIYLRTASQPYCPCYR